VLSALLLLSITWTQKDTLGAKDFEPFHKKIADSINNLPLVAGSWHGTERAPLKAAIELLRPNAVRQIDFRDMRPQVLKGPRNDVSLVVVQCKWANDMYGHFPPNCYPAHGDTLLSATPRDWRVNSIIIQGMEYQFELSKDGRTYRRIVYNFMVVPRKGIERDMNELQKATEDYQQRYLGAAQFQLVFNSPAGQEMPVRDRDQVFVDLMTRATPVIELLRAGE